MKFLHTFLIKVPQAVTNNGGTYAKTRHVDSHGNASWNKNLPEKSKPEAKVFAWILRLINKLLERNRTFFPSKFEHRKYIHKLDNRLN